MKWNRIVEWQKGVILQSKQALELLCMDIHWVTSHAGCLQAIIQANQYSTIHHYTGKSVQYNTQSNIYKQVWCML